MKNEIFNHVNLLLKNEMNTHTHTYTPFVESFKMIERESKTEKTRKRPTCNLFTLYGKHKAPQRKITRES